MIPEDLQEITCCRHQEHLLYAHGFEPVLADDRELFIRTGAEVAELYTHAWDMAWRSNDLRADRGRG